MNQEVKFHQGRILIDGTPVPILSGAIHYFRVPEPLWHDRLLKLKQCGLNTVETYVCWNLHEARKGKFDFSGMLSLGKFIDTAKELGLYVIVRPGPFICAEWDNGGLPVWLMTEKGMSVRCSSPAYLRRVRIFFKRLIPLIARRQHGNGGPVIAVQVENEYGAYGTDSAYLMFLRDLLRELKIHVPLFTADGAHPSYLSGGSLPDLPLTLTFGSRSAEAAELSAQIRPDDPFFCSEFWLGWFDAWGTPHRTRPAREIADELDQILRRNGNVNFYMFHGGTNFGINSGANGSPNRDYAPTTTSYDYDAPLNESGDPTEKYFAIQETIRKYRPDAPFGTPVPSRKKDYGTILFSGSALLLENLDNLAQSHQTMDPEPMEFFGENSGFIHYRTHVRGPVDGFIFYGLRDRAQIFINGNYCGTFYRNDEKCEVVRSPNCRKPPWTFLSKTWAISITVP